MKIIDLVKARTGYVKIKEKTRYRVQWHNHTRTWVYKVDIDGIKFEVVK